MEEVGLVTQINNYLVKLDGLPTARINDLVESEKGNRGWISGLFENHVEVFLLDEATIKPGELFKKSANQLSVNIGDYLLGRAINPLGVPIDGKALLTQARYSKAFSLDTKAAGIRSRKFISSQFEAGLTMIDLLIPIGKGQRELVVGDARSGKENFLINLIVNQKNTGLTCIYAAIGKPITNIRNLIDTLAINKALSYSVVVAASSTDPAPLIFLTPQTAFTIAEYFQKKGRDVLIILDDLGNHAKVYREMSLLAGKVPGRESYPGDIFYQHSHLLERAGNFTAELGGGSITAIPSIEINLNDFTTFIPTNLMSMTDGHLLFRSSLYNQGQRPSIDISLSVSRVGSQTQNTIQKLLALKVKSILTKASQLATLTSFGAELSPQTQLIHKQGEIIKQLLLQEDLTFIAKDIQTILLALVFSDFFLNKPIEFIINNKKKLIDAFQKDTQLQEISNNIKDFKNEEELFIRIKTILPKLEKVCS